MAFYALDSTGLSHFWDKFKARLLPQVTSSDAGKIARVSNNGTWVLAGSQDFKGDTGVGFLTATVNSSYHLILTKTDNTTVDSGYVRGPEGPTYTLTNADKTTIVNAVIDELDDAEGAYF